MITCFIQNGEYVAVVDKYPSLSWIADTEEEAIKGLKILISEIEMELE